MLSQQQVLQDNLAQAISEYFKTANDENFSNLLNTATSLKVHVDKASDTIEIIKYHLKNSSSSKEFNSSYEALKNLTDEMNETIFNGYVIFVQNTISQAMHKLSTKKPLDEIYLNSLSTVKQTLINQVRNIFGGTSNLGTNRQEKSLALVNLSDAYEEIVSQLLTTDSLEDTEELTILLGRALTSFTRQVGDDKELKSNNIGEYCAKLLTSINEADKRSYLLDDVSKDLTGMTRDLETSILFASAGTWNADDNLSYSGEISQSQHCFSINFFRG